jgi:hypothetical protein
VAFQLGPAGAAAEHSVLTSGEVLGDGGETSVVEARADGETAVDGELCAVGPPWSQEARTIAIASNMANLKAELGCIIQGPPAGRP